jgi:hypothetical protein
MIRCEPDRTMELDERRLFRISLSFSYMPDCRTYFPGFQAQLHADLPVVSSESDPYPSTLQLSPPSSLDRSYIDTIILTILALSTKLLLALALAGLTPYMAEMIVRSPIYASLSD